MVKSGSLPIALFISLFHSVLGNLVEENKKKSSYFSLQASFESPLIRGLSEKPFGNVED